MSKLQSLSYWSLNVTVLRAELHQAYDYLSKADCYVILKLPTSSARSQRTKVVSNCNNPQWNETFHFRIPSHTKNVLEITLYDEDPLKPDDHIADILFDIGNLVLGQEKTKMLSVNEKANEKLWVTFKLMESAEKPGMYWSNGVLMAAPLSILEIFPKHQGAAENKNHTVKLTGAYKEERVLSCGLLDNCTRFYINKDLETELCVKDFIDLELKSEDRPGQDMALRLDFDIPSAEKHFLEKRKVVVGRALQKLLELSSPPDTDKVPLVGVVCSGGGTRAMTGTFGGLKALQTLGILDAVSYITGVSGSTWAMSTLYENSYWSKEDMGVITEPMKIEMIKRYEHILSTEKLRYYKKEMKQKEKEGHPVSYIDMWGLAIEHLIYGKKWESTLSDQKRALSEGQNPLPIYTAVNTKSSKRDNKTENEWCEFSPFEVGIPKYGAFVPTENFGSEYFMGHQLNNLPENRLPFLIGIWSSAFSVNLTDVWQNVTGYMPHWIAADVTDATETNNPSIHTIMVQPAGYIAEKIAKFLTGRPISCKTYNFLRGLSLHKDYYTSDFFIEQETHPDMFPNQLTPADPILKLVDAGLACNIAFTPVLRTQRRMDLILSLNYSWDLDQFEVLKNTKQHCTDHRIPFPHIDFSRVEKEPMKEVYVFEDENNPIAPIVVHFPMVNLTFREFKAPGVKREGADELKQGEVDVSTKDSPYRTRNLAFQPEDFQKLMDLANYNVLNNRDILLSALRRALQRASP
ncbi:cytosolic phospholipase A2 zeta-like [Alosa pseudoharengus]|uniref:cytosolic phospholipase A2 zeta-like n=1 Tax=Alosa pseudoharengus TaxID=34774 RepID=UPI003F88C2C6